jgi:cytochrome c-type biogenesis protein CcmH
MQWWQKILIFVVIGWQTMMPAPVYAQSAGEIAKELICMCGCTAVLDNCTHEECMVRDAMITTIKEKLAKGQPREEIVQFFVTQYGEEVLSSPPKRGFNLTAWLLPFAGIISGGIVVGVLIKKWVRLGRNTIPVVTNDLSEGKNAEYERRLEQELKDFDMRGYR